MSLIKQSESKLKELSNAETSELSDDQSKSYSILRKALKSLLLIHSCLPYSKKEYADDISGEA